MGLGLWCCGDLQGFFEMAQKNYLIERLHFIGASKASEEPWVYYELLDKPLGDFPDDGKPVVVEIVKRIRDEFNLGLAEAYKIWKQRRIEL